jgi:hypothetical protein
LGRRAIPRRERTLIERVNRYRGGDKIFIDRGAPLRNALSAPIAADFALGIADERLDVAISTRMTRTGHFLVSAIHPC